MAGFSIGDLVLYKGKEDGIILHEESPLGFKVFTILLLDSGNTVVAHRLDIDEKTPTIEVNLLDDDIVFSDQEVLDSKEPTKRFADASEEDIKKLRQEKTSKSTNYQTVWGVKVLKEWLKETGKPVEFEYLEKEELGEILKAFYCAVRTGKGELYSKNSFKNIRAAIQRHLMSPPYNREFSIIDDAAFKGCNDVYEAYLANIRKLGLDKTKSKEAIPTEYFPQIYETFTHSPQGLQYRVFFEIGIHFGRRGREGLRELNKNSFVIKKNSAGVEYVEMAINEKEKTKRGTNLREKEKSAAMFAIPGSKNCPVHHFKMYLSKLHPELDCFYQRPRAITAWNESDDVWYANAPLGRNLLASLLPDICTLAKLPVIYTNHCLRVTCATALHEAGFASEDIITVTGHKNTLSLQPYINAPNMEKREKLSTALVSYKGVEVNAEDQLALPESTSTTPMAVCHHQNDHLEGPPLKRRLADSKKGISLSQESGTVQLLENNRTTKYRQDFSVFPNATFNNCTFHFN